MPGWREWGVVIALFGIVSGCLFWGASFISGPFIFFDENTYFWLAHEIHDHQRFHGYQYNPLYPILVSLTFFISDPVRQFFLVKLINVSVYASAVVPIYLLCR